MKQTRLFIVILCFLSGICLGSRQSGIYTVVVMEKRGTLTDAEIEENFDLEKYAHEAPSGTLENLKRALRSMGLYSDKETTVYRRERAFVQYRGVWIESVEISKSEYEQARQGTDPLEHFPADRDVFIYAPEMKIQLIKHKTSGFKGISCGVFDDSYSGDPFWLFASDGYADHLYGKYRMETIHVSSNKVVLGKSNEYATAELVISMDDDVMQDAKYYINEVLVREAVYGEHIVLDGVQFPKTTRVVYYLGTGLGSKGKAIREVTYTLIPSSSYMGDVAESGYPFPYDEDIYCVDYRNGAARDVFLTTNGVVRELRPVGPARTNASPTNAITAYYYDRHEPASEMIQSRLFEAMVIVTQAYLESSLSDADQSIALYREILADDGLADVDRIHCMLGLARACICRGILDPPGQVKMEKAAVTIIQKITGDEALDPILRNIAGQFSSRWEDAKQRGQPQEIIEWYDWMDAIKKVD